MVAYCTGYVEDLIGLIMGPVFEDPTLYREAILKIHIPPDLSAEVDHPEKEEVIGSYVSRFNPGEVGGTPRIAVGCLETHNERAGPHMTG